MANNHKNSARTAKKKMAKTYTPKEVDEMEEFQDTDEEEYEDDDEEYEEEEDDEEPEDEVPEGERKQLTIDDILSVDDTNEEPLYIREWGGNIVIRGLSKLEFDQMRKASKLKSARGRSQEILEREITMSGMVQPRVTSVAQYNLLMEKSAGVMVRILNAITDKSGMSEVAEQAREKRFRGKR